jgi:hypothetical protein
MATPPTSRLSAILVALAFTSIPLASQQSSDAGLGTVKRFFNASDQTKPFDNLVSGIAYVNGKVYAGTNAGSGKIYIYENGVLKTTKATPLAPTGGTFDMDTDGALIFAASASGIIVFDPVTFGTTSLKIKASGGLQTLAKNPIPVTIANFHSVAYNPKGNSGKGSLFVGSKIPSTVSTTFPIVEIDLAGKVIKTYANNQTVRHDASGLTFDPRTGNLWVMTEANSLDIIELDASNNMKATGVRFRQGVPGVQWIGRCCGGICGIPGGDTKSYTSDFDMAVLTRLFGDDYAFIQRVHLYPGRLGYHAAKLEGSVNSTTLGQGVRGDGYLGTIKANDIVRWRVDKGTSQSNNLPAITLIDAGSAAEVDHSFLPFFPELRVNPISPATLMVFGTVGSAAFRATVPAKALQCFWPLRMQAVYLDTKARPPFQLAATNEIWMSWSDEKTCSVIVETKGLNSFNSVTSTGFFRVIHKGGLPITEVTFDILANLNPLQAPMAFDVDQATMADFFNAGNSTAVGFKGTYRNGSDVKTGLVYDAKNWPVHGSASAGANSGFMARNGSNNGNGNTVKTLTFRFAGNKFLGSVATPKIFEFDCDTDGGIGANGASMAGMVITVKFLGGIVRKGVLRVDTSSTVSRSVTGF